MEDKLKQLKISVKEQQKVAHLQAVEKATNRPQRVSKFDWAMPLTVLLTAVTLCFLLIAPEHGQREVGKETAATAGYEEGYFYDGVLQEMPSSLLVKGVKRLSEMQLVTLNELIVQGTSVSVDLAGNEPIYELGLMQADEEVYVRVYSLSSYDGYIFEFVEEGRMLEIEIENLYGLLYNTEPNGLRTASIMLLAIAVFGYAIYVDKKYMKDVATGRKRKQFANVWHGVISVGSIFFGGFYLLFARGAYIPLAYVIVLGGIGIVAFLDRKNEEFAYRKYHYIAQTISMLFILTLYSFY